MSLDLNFNPRTPLSLPGFPDPAQVALPPLPERFPRVPLPDMPERMLVVIDGWSDTPKTLVGTWVAEGLGGLFIDSEKLLRALLTGCIKSGRDVNDYLRVESWCESAAVDIGFARNEVGVLEAQAGVNGDWLSEGELVSSDVLTNRRANDVFRNKVRQIIRNCAFDDRVVVAGSDLGFEFASTPYKFFLDNTDVERDRCDAAGFAFPWAGDPNNYPDGGFTFFRRGIDTLCVDSGRVGPSDLVCILLVESVARAFEMGFIGGPLPVVLERAYATANAARERMKVALGENPEF